MTHFSHLLFWDHPLSTLCFFALGMSFFSLWVRKTAWLWGSFLVISLILAVEAKIATFPGLIPIVLLFLCHFFLNRNIKSKTRLFLVALATAISLALLLHWMPGFHNWQLVSQFKLSPHAYPYSLWLNFDKPFIGIFILALGLPLIRSRAQLLKLLKVGLPMSLVGIFLLMGIALKSGQISWDPKIPIIVFIWIFDNLLLVSIPEEAFFRGFLQREIYHWFGQTRYASIVAVALSSLIFTLAHIAWMPSVSFLSLVFIAGVIYGTIYQVTKTIEASILCHFGLNLIHFLFFTYPALMK